MRICKTHPYSTCAFARHIHTRSSTACSYATTTYHYLPTMSAATTKTKPAHLEPSKLGTKEYWDDLYTTEISNHAHDPSDTGTVWFDDSDAEAKIIDFLLSPSTSPLHHLPPSSSSSSSNTSGNPAFSFLDLGTGNGSLLFGLRDAAAGRCGAMLGVDYSARSVELARRVARERRRLRLRRLRSGEEEGGGEGGEEGKGEEIEGGDEDEEEDGEEEVRFLEHDILRSPPGALLTGAQASGWDVVLDKGTFDAVSLSCPSPSPPPPLSHPLSTSLSPTSTSPSPSATERYRESVLPLVRGGGVFLVTSCNWTEEELRGWFEGEGGGEEGEKWGFEVVGRVRYPSFSFGGVKGQAISTLCFRKVRR